MIIDPDKGPDKSKDPQPPHPAGGASPIDYPRENFLALRDALLNPNTIPAEISICASNFCNVTIPALARGTLSPDHALLYISVCNPQTGNLLFQEQQLIEPLLCAISNAVRVTVAREGPKGFISRDALDALCPYVAAVDGITVATRLKVYEAIVTGSTKTIQFGGQRRSSEGVIDQIARDLQSRANAHPKEVADILLGIGNTPTHVLLAQSVDRLISQLSAPGYFRVPVVVQAAALEAMRCRVESAANRGNDGRMLGTLNKQSVSMIMQEALVTTMQPVIFRTAAENMQILLTTEVAAMRKSYEGLAKSDFTHSEFYNSWSHRLKAAISRANVMFPSPDDAKEVSRSLTEALGLAMQVERGVSIMTWVKGIEGIAPAFVTKGVARLAHRLFRGGATD